jgi:hypothetical protein
MPTINTPNPAATEHPMIQGAALLFGFWGGCGYAPCG